MWAQLVKFKMKPGSDAEMERLDKEWVEKVGRGTDSGWQRIINFKANNEPDVWYEIVFFESEEKARTSENSPEHQAVVQGMMAIAAGEPEFVDLTPVTEHSR